MLQLEAETEFAEYAEPVEEELGWRRCAALSVEVAELVGE